MPLVSNNHLMRVLTLATSMSYNCLTACLICGLLARTFTMNTSVLLSSIFFIADSVVRGFLIIEYLSSFTVTIVFTDFLAYWNTNKHIMLLVLRVLIMQDGRFRDGRFGFLRFYPQKSPQWHDFIFFLTKGIFADDDYSRLSSLYPQKSFMFPPAP